GLGLYEFLQWAEDMAAEPVLAVYAGYSLKGAYVKPGPDLEPYIQDALDEIEYITGPATSRWGSLRAKAGHPSPFTLTYVEVGNEISSIAPAPTTSASRSSTRRSRRATQPCRSSP